MQLDRGAVARHQRLVGVGERPEDGAGEAHHLGGRAVREAQRAHLDRVVPGLVEVGAPSVEVVVEDQPLRRVAGDGDALLRLAVGGLEQDLELHRRQVLRLVDGHVLVDDLVAGLPLALRRSAAVLELEQAQQERVVLASRRPAGSRSRRRGGRRRRSRAARGRCPRSSSAAGGSRCVGDPAHRLAQIVVGQRGRRRPCAAASKSVSVSPSRGPRRRRACASRRSVLSARCRVEARTRSPCFSSQPSSRRSRGTSARACELAPAGDDRRRRRAGRRARRASSSLRGRGLRRRPRCSRRCEQERVLLHPRHRVGGVVVVAIAAASRQQPRRVPDAQAR